MIPDVRVSSADTAMTGAPPRPRRRWVRAAGWSFAVLAVLVAGTVAAVGVDGGYRRTEPIARRTGPAATTPVTRQTLVESVTLPGELSYGPATPVTSTAEGTVTWLPEIGATVGRGDELLRVDDGPVILLLGELPMYRQLTEGAVGADVRQLESNLRALGYRGLTVNDTFDAATTVEVKRWQRRLKLPETGVVDRGRVHYVPEPLRIAARLVRVGASASGDVLSYTGDTRVVTVTGERSKLSWATPGVAVELSTGNGAGSATTGGDVVGESAAPGDPGGAAGSPAEAAAPDRPAGISVTVRFADQAALGTAAGAPVTVRHVVRERREVLTVPVHALLALAEGGYGVELAGAEQPSRIVAVEVGMFADGRVEITGAGLSDGTLVGVPA